MNAQHLTTDELADAAEGLLDPERAAFAESHLALCPDCYAHSDALRAVTATLQAAFKPPTAVSSHEATNAAQNGREVPYSRPRAEERGPYPSGEDSRTSAWPRRWNRLPPGAVPRR
jgi:anti-sigma factor RsiW